MLKYITFFKNTLQTIIHANHVTLEDFLRGLGIPTSEQVEKIHQLKKITLHIPEEKLAKFSYPADIDKFPAHPKWDVADLHKHYETFHIPKKSGGLREINAPDEELSEFLRQMKYYFESTCKAQAHNAAHAYIKERSTLTCVKAHQNNKSRWFLKLDFHDFFGSHTLEYTLAMLENIYPWCIALKDKTYKKNLTEALKYAFLDGKLPQGTPLSPTLTNILMTPIDYEIDKLCRETKSKICYTRYADDIYISSPYKIDIKPIIEGIQKILTEFHAPFELNTKKTRFGSISGRNWILGIMLNKNNQTTVGHKQNQRLKAALFNLHKDAANGIVWSAEDKQILQGQLAYARAVERAYIDHAIETLDKRFGTHTRDLLKY